MKKNNSTFTVRIILSFALLYFVWTNSHWSVALSISLFFIYCEINSYRINNSFRFHEKTVNILYKLYVTETTLEKSK